ncbi:hypothetical protein RFI_17673, partial [Reticulomyxa filosa]
MSDITYKNIPICKQLYDVPYFFPENPEQGLVFYCSLLGLTLFVLCYVLSKIHRQRLLLQRGEIRMMKGYLLPIYMTFLYCCVIVYGVKAIDIAIAFIVYRHKFQSGMPVGFAILHAASFWTSEFWLFDLLIVFLVSNSHGTLMIRRAFWFSTVVWIVNVIVIAIGHPRVEAFLNFVGVYGVQCWISLLVLLYMYIQKFPHHSIQLWTLTILFFVECFLRLIADFLRYHQ